jgi:hypothetical protein
MTNASNQIVKISQPAMQQSRRLQPILLVVFLAFSVFVPSASAKCYQDLKSPIGASALAAGVDANVDPEVVTGENAPVSIVGLWHVTFHSGGQVVDVAFDAWHSDGTEILNDYTNPIEGNVCLGVWRQTGTRTYKLTHPSWSFDMNGNLQGIVWIREVVTVSPDGNSYSGSYKYDIYDTSNKFVEEFTGSIKASRIKPD